MRRYVSSASLAAAAVLLTGCHYASSPVDGFGTFIGDTHTVTSSGSQNRPPGLAENMRRVEGQDVPIEPLTTEPGNIWPGPAKPEKTLEDLQREDKLNGAQVPGTEPNDVPNASAAHPQPRPYERGSSTPPPSQPQVPALPPVEPLTPMTQAPSISLPPPSIDTPNGVGALNRGGNGITTATTPGGSPSIVVPNGNGTSTVIGPDGTTSVVPTPR